MTETVKAVLERSLQLMTDDIKGLSTLLGYREQDVQSYKDRITILTKQKQDIEAALASE